MSDSKPEESVPAADDIKSEFESASTETAAETIPQETAPSSKVDLAESADPLKDEKVDEECEESMPKSNTITNDVKADDKATPAKPDEPDTTAPKRKDSSSSQKSVASERKQSSASDSTAVPERKQSSASDTTTSKHKQSSASDNTAPTERKQSAASDIAVSERKQSSASDATAATERKKSSASDISVPVPERKQTNIINKPGPRLRKKYIEPEANDELQDMIKEISGSKPEVTSSQTSDKPQTGKETTENLISVLEDGMEGQTKEKSSLELPATTSADGAPSVKPPKPKKYLYKLKSKTGKILHYTSTVPITLKRPIIHLTKMPDTSSKSDPVQKVRSSEKDDVDSDNSTKENNVKENEAPNDNVMRTVRKKGRPPLSSRPPPPVITLDGNASDTDDPKNKSSASFSMQTRKRQLKFLPDGRLVTPEKRIKTDDKNQSSSSDSDIDIVSDTEKATDSAGGDKLGQRKSEPGPSSSLIPGVGSALTPKKFRPDLHKMNSSLTDKRKYKKVFDYESYYREKSGLPSQSGLARTPIGNRSFASNLTPIRKVTDTPKLKPILPSSSAQPKKASSVDPAQLLSSLIGVPISSNQLNIVKFKPKIIQERANTIVASTPKKVTFEDDRNTKFAPANQSELLKSTPFKIVSKPTYQKILPKPSLIDRTPITQTRMAYQPASSVPSASSVYITSNSAFLRESLRDTLAKFETFSDTKVVKTKEGPKRCIKRKLDEDVYLKDNNSKTLYDLMYEIFEKMPSWNLHVVPDTNCFCIAQVSRGRMGIPTLKKSIEINSEFFAKVYVHQLQCKRYDGIYDTESKIIKLIKEIDALAA